MPEKQSRDNICLSAIDKETLNNMTINVPDFTITAAQVEDLVSEIKENLRLTSFTTKARPCISRRSSRASPYRIPSRCIVSCDKSSNAGPSCSECAGGGKHRRFARPGLHATDSQTENSDDPYELLQKLIKDGGLVQEAVRRLQQGLTQTQKPTKSYYYDSDEEPRSPIVRHNCSQESAKCN